VFELPVHVVQRSSSRALVVGLALWRKEWRPRGPAFRPAGAAARWSTGTHQGWRVRGDPAPPVQSLAWMPAPGRPEPCTGDHR